MTRFIARKLVSSVLMLVAVGILTFFLTHLAVGDPTAALLGSTATPEQQQALRTELGLDRSLWAQFTTWIVQMLHGDLGTSWSTSIPVAETLAQRLPATLSIVVAATVLAGALGVLVGTTTGLRPGGVLDKVLSFLSVVLFALPGFWVSLVLITWFAIDLKVLPAVGYVALAEDPAGWLRSIVLPAVSLALSGIVAVGEQLRTAVVDTSGLDYVRTLRARGLSTRTRNTHIVRNAVPAALTVLSLQFIGFFGGAIVVESIFALPGIGALTSSASLVGDVPVLIGVTLLSVVVVLVINTALDLVLGWVNPKVRVR
ncbi:MAG TPA: ABC transporter permease [Cellulomonas sp.]